MPLRTIAPDARSRCGDHLAGCRLAGQDLAADGYDDADRAAGILHAALEDGLDLAEQAAQLN